MEQMVESLDEEEVEEIARCRAWVREHYEPSAAHKYDTVDGKLSLVDAILKNGWIRADETIKLQCLGVALGDALAQQIGLTWVAVEDEYGRDAALKLDDTSILLFPLTMISKRVEDGEDVDVYDLFNDVTATVANIVEHGEPMPP